MQADMRTQALGAEVRAARKRAGLTLRALSRELGVAISYLCDIEHGRRVPSEDLLRRMADRLGLDLDGLLARAGRLDGRTREYLVRTPAAMRLLRTLARLRLGEEAVAELEKRAAELSRRRR